MPHHLPCRQCRGDINPFITSVTPAARCPAGTFHVTRQDKQSRPTRPTGLHAPFVRAAICGYFGTFIYIPLRYAVHSLVVTYLCSKVQSVILCRRTSFKGQVVSSSAPPLSKANSNRAASSSIGKDYLFIRIPSHLKLYVKGVSLQDFVWRHGSVFDDRACGNMASSRVAIILPV